MSECKHRHAKWQWDTENIYRLYCDDCKKYVAESEIPVDTYEIESPPDLGVKVSDGLGVEDKVR